MWTACVMQKLEASSAQTETCCIQQLHSDMKNIYIFMESGYFLMREKELNFFYGKTILEQNYYSKQSILYSLTGQEELSVRQKHTELIICGWMESGHVGPRGGLTSGLTTQQSAVSHKAKRERKGPLMRSAHC